LSKEIIYLNENFDQNSRERFEFFEGLLDSLRINRINYIVVNGYQPTLGEVGRDIDLFINERDVQRTVELFKDHVHQKKWKHIFLRKSPAWFPRGLIQFCASRKTDLSYIYVNIDVIFKPFIFAGNCQYPIKDKVDIDELIFLKNYLMKMLAHVPLKDSMKCQVEAISNSSFYRTFFTENELSKILTHYTEKTIPADAKQLRRKIQWRFFYAHPMLSCKNTCIALLRKIISPYLNKIPLIVILGPDGVGKSTLINNVINSLRSNFFAIERIHWRPQLIPNLGSFFSKKSNSEERSYAPRRKAGKLGSLRFLYYYLDYVLGYFFRMGHSISSELPLIIYDRYLYDFYVDSKRYGIKSINRLFFLIKIFPKPVMVVLLSDEPEKILARKTELTVSEIQDQYRKYQHLIRKSIIDKVYDLSKMSFQQVETEFRKDILNLLEKRYSDIHSF